MSPACSLPGAGVDHRADDRAHHLVAEGIGADLEAQQAVAVVGRHLRPPRQHHVALHRRLGLAGNRPRACGRTTRSRARRSADRTPVAGPASTAADRRATTSTPGTGSAPARSRCRSGSAATCAEKRALKSADSAHTGLADHDRGTAHPVDAAQQRLRDRSRREIATDDLAPTVHAGVGAAGADEVDRLLHDLLDRLAELAHHRADAIVLGEPVERGAVVGDGQPGSLAASWSTTASTTRGVVRPRGARQHRVRRRPSPGRPNAVLRA